MVRLLDVAGYKIPETSNDMMSMSKAKGVSTLGEVLIEQINEDAKMLERWILHNAWVQEVTFGELDYGNDELTEMTMKFRYDWASLSAGGGATYLSGPKDVS
tara:strand:+ start:2887 stop:3192 length:306 start_codon:yes stop_codon:yes gene_type:complete